MPLLSIRKTYPMKYKTLSLLFLVICGCGTLNKNLIETAERSIFQPLVLTPDYEIYDIRIDLIRQKKEKQVNDSITEKKKVPYHPLGFHLGNGLFIDLNDNLSLLVPKLLNSTNDENFTITQGAPGPIFKGIINYEKTDNVLTKSRLGLFKTKSRKRFHKQGSVISVNEGFFSKYIIIKADSTLTYRTDLSKTTVHKYDDGYYYKTLFGRKEYRQVGKDILIGNKYIFRNKGDVIEILVANGLSNREYLIYSIIKLDNRIYLYDKNYRGLEIILTEKHINVFANNTNIDNYSIK